MATEETAAQLTADWPEVKSGPLMVGGILIGIGAVVAMAGVAVAGMHVVAATRAWIKELETPPSQLARLKWEQARAAAVAGAATWQGHPNAQVRLVRRASSAPERLEAGRWRPRPRLDTLAALGTDDGLQSAIAEELPLRSPRGFPPNGPPLRTNSATPQVVAVVLGNAPIADSGLTAAAGTGGGWMRRTP